ncbi:MAG TPA: C4-type zinc ribbon domain-containing protein [Acidimicrobiales bacterium]|nr:C4-type zinc ribbon domain-containing protein [Acidimicrobiales bacterium]
MSALEAVLSVQDHDTVIDQLRHRRQSLPERAALQALEARRRELAARRQEAAARRDEVAARQAELERAMAVSEARVGEIDRRMYSGQVTASRDLQAMAAEIEHLKERVSDLEDAALAAMEEREPLDAEVAGLDREDAILVADADRLTAALAAAEAAIDADLAGEQEARRAAAEAVPGDLAATYEKLRARLGGIGAARLEHGTCMGCHLRLPATELDRLKREPPDSVAFCDQCGRILVR